MNQVDHQYYQERLSAFTDNELPLDERARVEAHLKDCPECRERLVELRRLEELVADHTSLGDSDYWEKSAQRIEAALPGQVKVVDLSVERKRHSALWWRLPAIAASVIFLVYLGLHEKDILKQETPASPQPAPSLKSTTPQQPSDQAIDRTTPPAETKDVIETGEKAGVEADRQAAGAASSDTSRPAESRAKPTDPKIEVARPALSPSPGFVAPAAPSKPDGLVAADEDKSVAIPDALEDNRLQLTRERSAAAAQADNENLEAEDSAIEGYLAEETRAASDEIADLAVLRIRRDSLIAVLPDLLKKEPRSKVGAAKGGSDAVFPMVELQAGLKEAERKDKEARAKSAETMLIDTWFGICRISADSVEVNQGVAFLKSASKEGRKRRSRPGPTLFERTWQTIGCVTSRVQLWDRSGCQIK